MSIVEKRKITITRKNAKSSYRQHTITLPKTYASSLETLGINEILLVFNSFGGLLIPIHDEMDIEQTKRRVLIALPKIASLLKER